MLQLPPHFQTCFNRSFWRFLASCQCRIKLNVGNFTLMIFDIGAGHFAICFSKRESMTWQFFNFPAFVVMLSSPLALISEFDVSALMQNCHLSPFCWLHSSTWLFFIPTTRISMFLFIFAPFRVHVRALRYTSMSPFDWWVVYIAVISSVLVLVIPFMALSVDRSLRLWRRRPEEANESTKFFLFSLCNNCRFGIRWWNEAIVAIEESPAGWRIDTWRGTTHHHHCVTFRIPVGHLLKWKTSRGLHHARVPHEQMKSSYRVLLLLIPSGSDTHFPPVVLVFRCSVFRLTPNQDPTSLEEQKKTSIIHMCHP